MLVFPLWEWWFFPLKRLGARSLSLVGSTVELSDSDLEKLVAELDGMETLPSAEPQSITITDEDFATGDENIDR